MSDRGYVYRYNGHEVDRTRCTKCGGPRNPEYKGSLSWCQSCHNKANRKRQVLRIRTVRQYVMELKRVTPCSACFEKFHPAAMHYHHRDPTQKTLEISTLVSYSLERALEEIDKCDLLCANCHAIKHYLERNPDER